MKEDSDSFFYGDNVPSYYSLVDTTILNDTREGTYPLTNAVYKEDRLIVVNEYQNDIPVSVYKGNDPFYSEFGYPEEKTIEPSEDKTSKSVKLLQKKLV